MISPVWHLVTDVERLPNIGHVVLVYGYDKSLGRLFTFAKRVASTWNDAGWCWQTGRGVSTGRDFPISHWTECPEPPVL